MALGEHEYPSVKGDKLTGRYRYYNALQDSVVGPIVLPKYRVLFEDPREPDAPAKVLCPDPNWMACALTGGILPPIETYQRDRDVPDGEPKEHPYAEPNGTMTESKFVVAMNADANPITWTFLEFTDNGTQGCVLGHGTGNINLGIAQRQEGTKT